MVRGVLQTISWERLNQIGQESRRLDQEAKKSGKKRGDSRWRYILAIQTCAQLRIDCDRSTADAGKLALRLAALVGQPALSGELAKKWASRGSQIYASVVIECAAEMFGTHDRESLAVEIVDLGLLSIKSIGMLVRDGDIKSMVRGVLQTISWERLNQIGQESRRLDQEAKKSGKKRGDSRWRYILATQTCAQLRIDCDRSTADVEKLVLRLATLVGQSNLSGDLAKKWASRGSQLYASVIIECAAEMFDTQDRESLAAELADLGLLNIKFIKDALQNTLDSEE
jgi:hypothetical protein